MMVSYLKKLFCCYLLLQFANIHAQQSAIVALENDLTIAVVGTGYVGLVTGAGLSEFGNTVICADIVKEKIDELNKGVVPIYEPGLEAMIERNVRAGRLSFTNNVLEAMRKASVIFIAVGTPQGDDGSADLSAVHQVVNDLCKAMTSYKVIVTKSTVPIGTGEWIRNMLMERGIAQEYFDIVSNPEFLREGVAVSDFISPDRIVIGVESERATNIMKKIYQQMITRNVPMVFTTIATSETIKYASNALLAIKIGFINEMSNLCSALDASVYTVAYAMGLDKRIGPLFLNPGPGFGGSCFPKDCQALLHMAGQHQIDMKIVEATLSANEFQKTVAVKKLLSLTKSDIAGKNIAVLGLAFKANTDDVRESPSIAVIQLLLDSGAHVCAYDPAAISNMKKIFPDLLYCDSAYKALTGADACIIMTEWAELKSLDLEKVASIMKQKYVVDMRGILDKVKLKALGFIFDTIGS